MANKDVYYFVYEKAECAVKMKELVAASGGPKALVMTVNAGAIPADHWTQDPAVGGGRILGEVCPFVDLLRFVAGADITGWRQTVMAAQTDATVRVGLTFADGSIREEPPLPARNGTFFVLFGKLHLLEAGGPGCAGPSSGAAELAAKAETPIPFHRLDGDRWPTPR